MTGDGDLCLELVFGVSALPHPDDGFSSITHDPRTHFQGVAQVGLAALSEHAGQPNPALQREQHPLQRDLVTGIVPLKRHAASLCNPYS
jgi:hypothetical protein